MLMRIVKRGYLSALMITLMLVVVFSVNTRAGSEGTTVTIAHLNDLHSLILPSEERGETLGGIARIATLLKEIRQENPEALFLNGGDLVVGSGNKYQLQYKDSLPNFGYRGMLSFELMNKLKLDAMVLGNHEFDFGMRWLERLFAAADFPILSANTFYRPLPDVEGKEGELVTQPYQIFERQGVKVAVVGLNRDIYVMTSQVVMRDQVRALKNLLPWLEKKADLVVVLSHLGIKYDRELARAVEGIDLIVGGHSHTLIPEPEKIGGTLIVQADKYGRYLGRLDLTVQDGEITGSSYRLLPVKEEIIPDPEIRQFIAERLRVGEIEGEALSSSSEEQSSLGKLITDAMLWYTGADAALFTSGTAAGELESGPLTADDFFAVFWPYRARTVGSEKDLNENQLLELVRQEREKKPLWAIINKSDLLETIVTVPLSGEELTEILQKSREQAGSENYLQAAVRGVERGRELAALSAGGEYLTAVNLSLALGKGRYEELWKPELFKIHNREVFEAVLAYLNGEDD